MERATTGSWALSAAAAAVLVVLGAVSLLPMMPPDPSPAEAEGFSAIRAREILDSVAAAPHPVGSAEHERVRRDLAERLRATGARVEVQEEVALRPLRRLPRVVGARVQNLVARLPGTASTGAVLLVAHYDSVPNSPGAADDAAGVAAVVETLGLLAAGPPLRNDVIALLTDGEEIGLLGARAFGDDHPWMEDVALVVNFEARGASGPSIMFETGPGTGPLVADFAAEAPRPLAASYSYDVYQRLPNDTDFTVFKDAGSPGFNFAFIDGLPAYHSARDAVASLDPGSLQHHGDHAFALARHFADEDLSSLPTGGERVYFNLPLLGLLVYPASWSIAFAALAALLAVAAVFLALRRHGLSVGRFLLGIVSALLAPVIAVAAVVGVDLLLLRVFSPRFEALGEGDLYLFGQVLLAAALAWLVLVLAGRRPGRLALLAGGLVVWTLLTLGAALALPSSSYLFLWPLAGAAAAALVSLPRGDGLGTGARLASAALAAGPALLLWVPTLVLVSQAFGLGAGPILALPTALLVLLVVPGVGHLLEGRAAWTGRRWLPVAALAVLALLVVGIARFTARIDTARPAQTSLLYTLEPATGEARWVTLRAEPNLWESELVGGETVPFPSAYWFGTAARGEGRAAPAPVEPWAAPKVIAAGSAEAEGELAGAEGELAAAGAGSETLGAEGDLGAEGGETGEPESETAAGEDGSAGADGEPVEVADGEGRRVGFRVVSPRGAGVLRLLLSSSAELRAVTLAGERVELDPEAAREERPWEVVFYGVPAGGLEVVVELAGDAPLEVTAIDQAFDFRDLPGLPPRPPETIPSRFGFSELTLVRAPVTTL